MGRQFKRLPRISLGPDLEKDDPFDPNVIYAFADPGGKSALRASSKRNPRTLPCPTCKEPNRLTPADRAQSYQCDACANRDESGGW